MDALAEAKNLIESAGNYYAERPHLSAIDATMAQAYAAIANAEAATRQAEALEQIAAFFGGSNIDDVLQWIADRQRK